MSRGKDGKTLFYRVFPATTRGLTSTIAVDWHLKVKYVEYDVSLTKNYSMTVNMQKINSIHKRIRQICGSHVLKSHAYFWPHLPKIIDITFSFPEIPPACKKPVPSINSLFWYGHF